MITHGNPGDYDGPNPRAAGHQQYEYFLSQPARPRYDIPLAFARQHHKNNRVLDVACGNGALYQALKAEEQATYTGIDLSPDMIKYCHDRYGQAADFRVGDVATALVSNTTGFEHVHIGGLLFFSITDQGEKADDLTILQAALPAVAPGGLMSITQSFCYSEGEYDITQQAQRRNKDITALLEQFVATNDRAIKQVHHEVVDLVGITAVVKNQQPPPYWFSEDQSTWGCFRGNNMGTQIYILQVT